MKYRDLRDFIAKLEAAAQSVVPEGASIVTKRYGGCSEIAIDPDCVIVKFDFNNVPGQDATQQMLSAAQVAGWSESSREVAGTQMHIYFRKSGYRAEIYMTGPDFANGCPVDVPAHTCGAKVTVSRQ